MKDEAALIHHLLDHWLDAKDQPQSVYACIITLHHIALRLEDEVLDLKLKGVKRGASFVCSYCKQSYLPLRAPKAGQRNFCPECREQGIPGWLATRDRRARQRASKTNERTEVER